MPIRVNLAAPSDAEQDEPTARAAGTRRRVLFGVPLVLLGVVLVTVLYQLATWPNVRELADRFPESTAFIDAYRVRREAAGERARVAWTVVPMSRISAHLQRAVVAAEDIEFFHHDGFSTSEIRAAIREAIEEREAPRGASTITQQLAKNLWLSPSRNPWRKVKEAILTRQLERRLTKRRILELYLNVVEFGRGIYGAEAASSYYFGRPANDLDFRQAAMLAASLPRPSSWHPGVGSRGYQRYVAEIERRVARATFLSRYVDAPPPPAPFVAAGDSLSPLDLGEWLDSVSSRTGDSSSTLDSTMTTDTAPGSDTAAAADSSAIPDSSTAATAGGPDSVARGARPSRGLRAHSPRASR